MFIMSQYTSPKIWGPHFWFMLRCLANNYPVRPTPEDVQHTRIFFYELQYLLPCDLCKYTFKQHYAKHPIEKGLTGKAALIEWVETIYQETKKVIHDNRIKIMEQSEENSEVKPIKSATKSRIDPLEEQLNIMRRNVMSKENNNRAIVVPTLEQIKAQSKGIPPVPKPLNKPIAFASPFEKVSTGKRNDSEQIRESTPPTKPANNAKKIPKPPLPLMAPPRMQPKPLLPPVIPPKIEAPKPIPKIEVPKSILMPLPQVSKPKAILPPRIPTYNIVPLAKQPVMRQDEYAKYLALSNLNRPRASQYHVNDERSLVLTRKCKKCEH